MPLRLRRGTDAERQLIIPLEGELVYTTDNKELYVGDGNTQGGILVGGEISLASLDDVDLSTPPQVGQTLKWDGFKFVPADDIDTDTQGTGVVEGSNYRIGLVGDDSSILLDTTTNTFFGSFVGDGSGLTNLVGAVQDGSDNRINIIGTDSTVIINSENNTITANTINAIEYYGDSFGYHKGVSEGDVIGPDSSVYLDHITGTHYGTFIGDGAGITNLTIPTGLTFEGNFVGPLTGDVQGSLTGDTFGTHRGTLEGGIIGPDSTVYFDVDTGTFFGNFDGNIVGGLNLTGTVVADAFQGTHIGNVLGNVTGDTVGFHRGTLEGDIIGPDSTVYFDLETGTFFGNFDGNIVGGLNLTGTVVADAFQGTHIGNLVGNVTGDTVGFHRGTLEGDIIGPDSTVYFDVETGTFFGNFNGTLTGNQSGDFTGTFTGDTTGTHTGSVFGNLTGDTFGTHRGTLEGDVIGPDSTVYFDVETGTFFGNFNGTLTGNQSGDFTGTFTGDTTGTHTGSVFGNLTGDTVGFHRGTLEGNIIGPDSTVYFDLETGTFFGNFNGTFNGNLSGDFTGTFTGDTTGTHTGSVFGNLTGDTFGTHRGILEGSVIGSDSTVYFDVDTASFYGTFYGLHIGNTVGDIEGSVFSQTSSVMVDAINNQLFAENGIEGNLTGDLLSSTGTVLLDHTTGNLNDSAGVTLIDSALRAFVGDVDGNVRGSIFNTTLTTTLVDHINETFNGTLNGNVVGDVVGSVFGDDSTVMVDGINLTITAEAANLNSITYQDFGGATAGLSVEPDDGSDPELRLIRRQPVPISPSTPIGTIYFDTFTNDDKESTAAYLQVYGTEDPVDDYVKSNLELNVIDETGAVKEDNVFVMTWDGKTGFGTFTPTAKLDVRGNGIFSGDVQAAAFKGSLVADDSTTIVDGIDGNITAPGYVQFGSFTTTERNAFTAANGMVIYNATTNRFQGYQNGAWINLDDGTAA